VIQAQIREFYLE
jgi:hypothetical protein